jgi:hypothetical protein
MQDKPMTPNGDLDALKQRLATALSHGDSTPDTQLDLTVGQAVDMLVPMYLRESLRARKQELEDFWDKIGYFQEALFMKARIEEIQAELENLKEDSTIGDVSDIELPPQIKGRLEYHSTQASNPPKELDDLLDGIFGKEAPTPLLEGTTGTEIMAQQSLREGWFVRRSRHSSPHRSPNRHTHRQTGGCAA